MQGHRSLQQQKCIPHLTFKLKEGYVFSNKGNPLRVSSLFSCRARQKLNLFFCINLIKHNGCFVPKPNRSDIEPCASAQALWGQICIGFSQLLINGSNNRVSSCINRTRTVTVLQYSKGNQQHFLVFTAKSDWSSLQRPGMIGCLARNNS